MWCMSMFSNLALIATPHPLAANVPERPLRSHSLLHIAVAKGDLAAVDAQLRSGVPLDLLAGDGLAPLHWALTAEDTSMIEVLLDKGSPVDARSAEGETPLMNAVQARSLSKVMFLLDRGADPDACDGRGFTALRRAAEMGESDIVRALLARGADPAREAHCHTSRSLAEARGETAIVDLLRDW
jgi:ankyrin repeat protein